MSLRMCIYFPDCPGFPVGFRHGQTFVCQQCHQVPVRDCQTMTKLIYQKRLNVLLILHQNNSGRKVWRFLIYFIRLLGCRDIYLSHCLLEDMKM